MFSEYLEKNWVARNPDLTNSCKNPLAFVIARKDSPKQLPHEEYQNRSYHQRTKSPFWKQSILGSNLGLRQRFSERFKMQKFFGSNFLWEKCTSKPAKQLTESSRMRNSWFREDKSDSSKSSTTRKRTKPTMSKSNRAFTSLQNEQNLFSDFE